MVRTAPARSNRAARSAAIALVAASVLWGTTGTAAAFMPDGVSPLAIGAATMGIGGVALFLLTARRAWLAIADPVARRWLLLGAVGVVAYPLAFYPSMHLAGVAIGNVVSLGSGPLFAAILEWTIERRRPGAAWVVATSGAIAGVVLLATGGHGGRGGTGDIVPGVLLGLVAGAGYALYTYVARRAIAAGHASTPVMGAMFGLGAVALIPVLLVTGVGLLESWRALGIAAYLVVGPMVLAYVLFGVGVRSLAATTATTITLLEPAVATLLAVAVVGERLTPVAWGGLVLILAAVAVIAARAGRAPRPRRDRGRSASTARGID